MTQQVFAFLLAMALALATLLMLLCERLLGAVEAVLLAKCQWAETVRLVVAVVRRMLPTSAASEAKAELEGVVVVVMTLAATLHEAVMAVPLVVAVALWPPVPSLFMAATAVLAVVVALVVLQAAGQLAQVLAVKA